MLDWNGMEVKGDTEQKNVLFVLRAKMNGKVRFYAWFPLWFINIQRFVIFLWMGIPHMVKIQRSHLKFTYLIQSDCIRWH